jgi:nitric oxide reductase subunit B
VPDEQHLKDTLSPWWRRTVFIILILGFSVLTWVAVRSYKDAPPIPEKVIGATGTILFTGADILAGQQVFLKNGLMENGTIWGHGAYLGPDFSAAYLHGLAVDSAEFIANERFKHPLSQLTSLERAAVNAEVSDSLKQNRHHPESGTLSFTAAEEASYRQQIGRWRAYFKDPLSNRGLMNRQVKDPEELRQLTAFFAWTAWASVANRPGKPYSYTNNFPYDPLAGNWPTSDAFLWSALSLITLLGGTALILFAFGRFDYLGWKGKREHLHPLMAPGKATAAQKATIKYFAVMGILFLAQVLVGGATAHYRAEPGTFYGLDLTAIFPTNLLRTWHLQLAIFWIATAYVAGGLFLASTLGGKEPEGQSVGINLLFAALALVILGSLFGEMLGLRQLLGKLWFWFGHQGWEYLDLGRGFQLLLAVGLLIWFMLLVRAVGSAKKERQDREVVWLFLLSALAIPVFYLPALFPGRRAASLGRAHPWVLAREGTRVPERAHHANDRMASDAGGPHLYFCGCAPDASGCRNRVPVCA